MYRSNRHVYQKAYIKVFRVVLFAIVKRKENNINLQKHGKIEVYIFLNITSSDFHCLLPHSKFPHAFPHSEFPLTCSLSEFLLTLLLKFPVHPYLRIPSLSFFQNALTLCITKNCLWNLYFLRIPSHSSSFFLIPCSLSFSQNFLTPSLTQIPFYPIPQ